MPQARAIVSSAPRSDRHLAGALAVLWVVVSGAGWAGRSALPAVPAERTPPKVIPNNSTEFLIQVSRIFISLHFCRGSYQNFVPHIQTKPRLSAGSFVGIALLRFHGQGRISLRKSHISVSVLLDSAARMCCNERHHLMKANEFNEISAACRQCLRANWWCTLPAANRARCIFAGGAHSQ